MSIQVEEGLRARADTEAARVAQRVDLLACVQATGDVAVRSQLSAIAAELLTLRRRVERLEATSATEARGLTRRIG